jgi:hypothetical protein
MCENPNGGLESLKAQAIAARTFLTFSTRGTRSPTIRDGSSAQVYSCARDHNGTTIDANIAAAVAATRGMVITHNGRVITGNFVAGALRDGACRRGYDPTGTERFVTINNGKRGSAVKGTPLAGPMVDNRGAMGQNLANCLAGRGYNAYQILGYFYGSDAVITGGAAEVLDTMATDSGSADQGPGITDPTLDDPMMDPPMVTGDGPPPTLCGSVGDDGSGQSYAAGTCIDGSDGTTSQCQSDGSWATVSDAGQCSVVSSTDS